MKTACAVAVVVDTTTTTIRIGAQWAAAARVDGACTVAASVVFASTK
jgi:hypothetical protein